MKEKILSIIADDKKRPKMRYISVFLLLGIVALVMTILNLLTQKGVLTYVTGVFALLCLINVLIVRFDKKEYSLLITSILFMIEIIALFTYFLIYGRPDGFSIIWASMLPACGMLLFGRKKTTILSAIMLAILIFFFWIPFGTSLLKYEYTETFRMRFPILFIAFYFVAALLEAIRAAKKREYDNLREQYKHLSTHDYLTDLLNRQGFNDLIKKTKVDENQMIMMLDVDKFKRVNDTYGHDVGDIVLNKVAKTVKTKFPDANVCRWGGEEFIVWYPTGGGDPEAIRKSVEEETIHIPNSEKTLKITISVGVAHGNENISKLINQADEAMYKAKQNGRNRVEWA